MTALPTREAALEAAEIEALKAALEATSGAVTRAAEILGVSPSTVQRRIGDLGLRDWLDSTYPLSARQPRQKKSRKRSGL